ncbi:hypothetical protein EHS25_006963 [Saitozyma podzolica]|jgi:hypothetical protein|uniref:Uncharacterized protein n=1 Tax=Saitozyma podzolica TaxID=1890683 RepID=A0A427XPM8_9TREE|nr:hypothetical protein EHS25_006963 [Saitozyma podzolica]
MDLTVAWLEPADNRTRDRVVPTVSALRIEPSGRNVHLGHGRVESPDIEDVAFLELRITLHLAHTAHTTRNKHSILPTFCMPALRYARQLCMRELFASIVTGYYPSPQPSGPPTAQVTYRRSLDTQSAPRSPYRRRQRFIPEEPSVATRDGPDDEGNPRGSEGPPPVTSLSTQADHELPPARSPSTTPPP